MQALPDLLFLTGLAFLFTHELDAIRQREWRFFFAALRLSEQTGYQLFTALHVPLFVLIVWFVDAVPFQIGMDVFLVIHAVLHTLLRKHPLIEFNNAFSRLWIYGGAALGVLHLLTIST